MTGKKLTDLPPELLDQITAYLPTASSVANLGLTNKSLHAFTEKDAWADFARARFPSLVPTQSSSWKGTARTLTTLSRAWDRKAIVARWFGPTGDITSYPSAKKLDRWRVPKGQTIGFAPRLDAYDAELEGDANSPRQVLAFSAGAEVCLRIKDRSRKDEGRKRGREEWTTYRPLSAAEGRDDITALHLLRFGQGGNAARQEIITGTAHGDLQRLSLPTTPNETAAKTYFVTDGLPVRHSSLLQRPDGPSLLAANLKGSRIVLYSVDATMPKVAPSSKIDIKPTTTSSTGRILLHGAWSTTFLSNTQLAVGLGLSDTPIEIYAVTPSGLDPSCVRKLSLLDPSTSTRTDELAPGVMPKPITTSVFPIHPFSADGQTFLTGAYDGLVRLHDLRSRRDTEMTYSDVNDDGAIYSLLTRGRETVVAGTSRHNLLKVFDLRLGSKCYSYLDAQSGEARDGHERGSCSLFLKNRDGGTRPRPREGSVYSLCSVAPTSPYLYVGVQNNIVEMAFTEILHNHPDPLHFDRWTVKAKKEARWNGWKLNNGLEIALYDGEILKSQKTLWDTWWDRHQIPNDAVKGLDRRWWESS